MTSTRGRNEGISISAIRPPSRARERNVPSLACRVFPCEYIYWILHNIVTYQDPCAMFGAWEIQEEYRETSKSWKSGACSPPGCCGRESHRRKWPGGSPCTASRS